MTYFVLDSTFNNLVTNYIRKNNNVDKLFINNLEITNFPEDAISLDLGIAMLIKSRFDNGYDRKQSTLKGKVIKIHQTRNGIQTKVIINYDDKTVNLLREGNILPIQYSCKKFVILTFKRNEGVNDTEQISSIYPSDAALFLLEHTIQNCKGANEIDDLIQSLIGKVFIDRPIEYTEYYGRRNISIEGQELDQQKIIEEYKISAMGVSHVFLPNNKQSINFCKGVFNGTEVSLAATFFSKIGEPFFTDKNNKKYIVYGDGARAAGVDLVDGKLVTINPLPKDNGAKILNRIASHGFLKAEEASLLIDGEESETYLSNLQFALSNGRTVRGAGLQCPVFVSFGAFGLHNGIMETNKAKGVCFKYKQIKNLQPIKIDLYSFAPEYISILGDTPQQQLDKLKKEIQSFIIEWCKENTELKAHQIVKFNGVTVLANYYHFPISINNYKYISVRYGGADFNNQVRSLVIRTKGEVTSIKKSPKVRGLTKKATAYQTNTIITKDEKQQDWVSILNRETIKGSSAIIDIFSNDDDYIDSDIIWNKGVLTVDGVEWTQEDLIAWVDSKSETYTIKREVCDLVKDELQHLKGVCYIQEDNKLYVVETVKGFFGYSSLEIEVSTADENHGISYLGMNEQQLLSLAGDKVSKGLEAISSDNLDNADLLIGSNDIPVFKLPESKDSLKDFLNINVPFRTKSYMGALANKSLHGIRIEWNCGKHTWSTILPFGVLLKYGNWDNAGNPSANVCPVISYNNDDDSDIISFNVLEDVFNFINMITTDNLSDLERKSLFLRSNIFTAWVNNLKTAKKCNTFTKAGVAFHQKVVADLTIPYCEKTGLPIIRISGDNPMLKNKELAKLVKKGEAVSRALGTLTPNKIAFLSRCPLPFFTAVKVEIDDNLDNSVVAVNPVVWIKSTFGDFDGDLEYTTDASQFGFNSPKQAVAFNNRFSAMSHHWDIFKKGKGDSPLEDALAVRNNIIGGGKSVKELLNSWTDINNTISIDDFSSLAASVHNHYKYNVGKMYNNSSALTQEIGNKAFNNSIDSVSSNEFKGLLESWLIYEEIGLGGWSKKNEAKINKLEEEVQTILENKAISSIGSYHESIDIIDYTFNTLSCDSTNSNPRRRKRIKETKPKVLQFAGFNTQVLKGAVLATIGRQIQTGKRDKRGFNSAILCQATRVIARKEITANEGRIFEYVKDININTRFGKQISTIASLRAQCK